jgi:DNA-binding transcriptional LysR family regulator
VHQYTANAGQGMEWGDIRVFLHVARAGQMAGASRALGMDHSTVSRRIARLEEKLGLPLFERAGRRLRLTDEGSKLLAMAEGLEAIIIRDVLSLGESRQAIAGRVRIGTSEGFGAHYLAPRLPALMQKHPGLEIELLAIPRTYSLGMRDVDIAITMDRPRNGDIVFKKLSDCSLAIYASSSYFRDRMRPASVDALRDHAWCGYINELLFTEELDMLTFGQLRIDPAYRTTSVTAQLGAVKAGSVIAVLPRYMADGHPDLEIVLPGAVHLRRTYWLSVHGDLAGSPRIRAVITQLETWVRQDRALLSPPPGNALLHAMHRDTPPQ